MVPNCCPHVTILIETFERLIGAVEDCLQHHLSKTTELIRQPKIKHGRCKRTIIYSHLANKKVRDELEKLDNRFTDYLIYMDQVEKRRLLLHCQLDYADYSKFHFVGPDGVLHKKPSAEPKPDTKYYDKANKQRIGSPRTVGLKSRNNIKCLRHVELMAKDAKNHKSDKMSKHVETEKVSIPVTSSRLDRA